MVQIRYFDLETVLYIASDWAAIELNEEQIKQNYCRYKCKIGLLLEFLNGEQVKQNYCRYECKIYMTKNRLLFTYIKDNF